MPSCRDIPPEVWEHARQALVFYFSRRQRASNAEDLAQETLMAIWRRDDYEFEKPEDFLRVCYGFAGRVLQHDYRQQQRNAADALPVDVGAAKNRPAGLDSMEARVLLEEVLRIGRSQLRESDWSLIQVASSTNPSEMPGVDDPGTANKLRVRLSRARRRLAQATGWKSF